MNPFFNEDHEDLRALAADFAEKTLAPLSEEIDQTDSYPQEVADQMAELGFFGIKIPEEYGGLGMDMRSYVCVMEEIAKKSPVSTLYISSANSLSTAPITGTDLEETDPYVKTSRYGFSRRVRFAIRINGAEPISWNFMTDIFTGNEYSEDQKEYEIDVKSQANWLLDDLKNVFLREIWEPEAFVGTKYSLVTINKDVYDALLQKLEGLTFENWFTLILVDIEQGTVIEEKQLPRKDGKEFESLFHKEDI